MIKSKKCSIEICNLPAFSKGLCRKHCSFKELKQTNSAIKSIKKSRAETEEKNKEIQEKRNIYFEYHLERATHSEHSGKAIQSPTKANICHIIPKGNHPSLQDNLENCIILTFKEHERFDYLLFNLEFDKLEKEFGNTWQMICQTIKKLLPLCKESTNLTRNLEKYLQDKM